jgi:hypothetical protein
MTWEENEKRDCREARFSLEGSKSCPSLGKHLNLSVSNIVHGLNSVVQKRGRFATPKARARMLDVAAEADIDWSLSHVRFVPIADIP